MTLRPVLAAWRTCSNSGSRAGFTLIELLAVMAIIVILAGLILNIAGGAQYKAAMSRANAEIQQMSTAMESYKADNGTYPRDNGTTNYTDTLNAQGPNGNPPPPDPSTYNNANAYLFQQLSGYSGLATGSTALTKVYITFLPGQLSTGSATPTTSTYILDPFGFDYGYSTANQLAQDQNNAVAGSANPPINQAGYNPTFDLWSTGGYATGGKNYTSITPALQPSQYNTLWAKNW
jgi:prepilin-type N-terminal cleavage/methylation domain-containing protein